MGKQSQTITRVYSNTTTSNPYASATTNSITIINGTIKGKQNGFCSQCRPSVQDFWLCAS